MISDDEIELIELYHRGELTDDARTAFEQKIVSDADFAREVNAYTTIMATIKHEGELDFTARLREWEDEAKHTEVKTLIFPKKMWAAAAAIFIFILPLGIWYYTAQQHSPEQLFDNYFKPYDDVVSSRSGTPNNDNMFLAGMEQYNNQNYTSAIPMFEAFLVDNPQHNATLFYLSICNLAVGNLDKTKEGFLQLQTQSSGPFKEMAEWYLALTYLKENEVGNADMILKRITENENHAFFEEAKSLYREIKR